ncbi:hypothetical protein BDQ12DRAFT_322205 [Crucibulum laeve]|uniref:Uncharacterized protein n=1 Tax=Crucibulum laeve TaxID=68775 RepID=A0A5C3LQX6_9AGAR|nr:hypothetical protein BDQ12DRAFT_322205 [Crucibulum laeve]
MLPVRALFIFQNMSTSEYMLFRRRSYTESDMSATLQLQIDSPTAHSGDRRIDYPMSIISHSSSARLSEVVSVIGP